MIIYNVTIKADQEIAAEWLTWMQQEHLTQMMETGCFERYRIAKLLAQEDDGTTTFVVQYECSSLNDYEQYTREFANVLRQSGLDKFGDKFIAFRTLMETID